MMIGQEKLKAEMVKRGGKGFPSFVLLEGRTKEGATELIKSLSKELDYGVLMVGGKVDEIKEIITLAATQSKKTFYFILDGDSLGLASKNALLKITEEPPYNATIIVRCNNTQSMLPTLISRASLYKLEDYTTKQLRAYEGLIIDRGDEEGYIVNLLKICTIPDEIREVVEKGYNVDDIHYYAKRVATNVGRAKLSNLFTIQKKVLEKKDGEYVYPLELFLNAVISCFREQATEEGGYQSNLNLLNSIVLTRMVLANLENKSLSKDMMIGEWLINLWGVYDGVK